MSDKLLPCSHPSIHMCAKICVGGSAHGAVPTSKSLHTDTRFSMAVLLKEGTWSPSRYASKPERAVTRRRIADRIDGLGCKAAMISPNQQDLTSKSCLCPPACILRLVCLCRYAWRIGEPSSRAFTLLCLFCIPPIRSI